MRVAGLFLDSIAVRQAESVNGQKDIAVDVSRTEIMLGIIILLIFMVGIQLNRIEKQNEGLWSLLIDLGADPLRRKH
jgi:hypothetical protein